MPTTVRDKASPTPDVDVDAWAMANGRIGVSSGWMDLWNDDGLRGGIGHGALGHVKVRRQTTDTASAARSLANAVGGPDRPLSLSRASDLAEQFVNAQVFRSQDNWADSRPFNLRSVRKAGSWSSGSSPGVPRTEPPPVRRGVLISPSTDRAAIRQRRLDSRS